MGRRLEPRPALSQPLDLRGGRERRKSHKDFEVAAPQLKNSGPKSSAFLLGLPLGKGPLIIGVSGREAHGCGARCEGGWAQVKGGLQVGADSSPLIMPPLAACLDNTCSHAMHMSNYSQLAKSYDIIKPFNPMRT